jgi:ketosteroid isomerase-like protein
MSMTASFAHLYEVRDGKIASMVRYVDSHMVMQALDVS